MAKMKTYRIARASSTEIGRVMATCITEAARAFMETLEKPAQYELYSREHASIRYTDNCTVIGDFVIMEA